MLRGQQLRFHPIVDADWQSRQEQSSQTMLIVKFICGARQRKACYSWPQRCWNAPMHRFPRAKKQDACMQAKYKNGSKKDQQVKSRQIANEHVHSRLKHWHTHVHNLRVILGGRGLNAITDKSSFEDYLCDSQFRCQTKDSVRTQSS